MVLFRSLRNQQCLRRFVSNWIHQDSESGFDASSFETRLASLSGGSVDVVTDNVYGIAFLKINNPSKRNAFSGKMIQDLRTASKKLSAWTEGKAVIIYGANHSFCSGADLSTVRALSLPEDGEKICMYMQDTLELIRRLPLISVAFIEGKAVGGGAELLTACDFRLMTEGAEIHFVHKNMGLIPGWGGVTRLINIVGREKALNLLLSSKRINPQNALSIGLVNDIVPLSQKDIFHEIQVRSSYSTSLDEDSDYSPDCTTHVAFDWLQNKFDIANSDVNVIRAIKSAVSQCSHLLGSVDSLRKEKDIFKSVWGAEANLRALSGSKHGK